MMNYTIGFCMGISATAASFNSCSFLEVILYPQLVGVGLVLFEKLCIFIKKKI